MADRFTTITVVHCWSAPRSRSTALLYSFESRGNSTIALDEPLYRRWLRQAKVQVSRPYGEPFLKGEAPPDDVDEAWRWEREKQCFNERIHYAVKGLMDEKDGGHRHVLLIRDPIAVLGSWMGKSGSVHGNNPHPDEVGIVQLLDVYSKILGASMNATTSNSEVVVIDSDDLAAQPRRSLHELCDALGIEYRESMLRWEAGTHKCDGPWSKWWYHDVWRSLGWDEDTEDTNSTGINHPRTARYRTVPPALLPALRMSMPSYTFLQTLTNTHQQRAITTPPSGKLYEDPRNQHVLVYVGTPGTSSGRGRGRIIPRDMAVISPFDSSVQGGDATWEGIRVYNGRIFHLDHHLNRLYRSAKALGFENMHTRSEIIDAIFRVLAANGMRDGAHMRLTITRGEKCTSSMNPLFNVYGTTLIILPEWKPTEGATTYDNTKGISLITAGVCRRSPPSTLDNKIHHNNMIQNILPKIQANHAGVADAIMLDLEGFVAETNATNLFLVRCDCPVLVTPSADHCLPGITRDTVLILAKELGIETEVRRVSLSEFYCADEVFTTGTMGELTPVTCIDGRVIGAKGNKTRGVVTQQLQEAYKE
ncbi:branched-chain amino acid aminotransferase, partial [Thalassiosira pseudonana CCMP1335]